LVRASALQAEGPRFEPATAHHASRRDHRSKRQNSNPKALGGNAGTLGDEDNESRARMGKFTLTGLAWQQRRLCLFSIAPIWASGFRRNSSIVCGVLACCLTVNVNADADLTPQQKDFSAKVLTQCDRDTYYFGPHEVSPLACTATGRLISNCVELIGYRGLKFLQPLAVPLTHLDVQLHVQQKLLFLIDYGSYRTRMRADYRSNYASTRTESAWDSSWSEPISNITPSMSAEVQDAQADRRLPPGAKAFGVMIQKDGQWMFVPGPDFPVETSLFQAFKRVGVSGGPAADSLSELDRTPGPLSVLSPVPQLLAKMRFIERIESEKPKSCAALFPREWPAHLPPLFAPGTPLTSWAKAMQDPPRFAGTTEQFVTAFPRFLEQAAQTAGFDAQAYKKESAFVMDSVRSCAQITPAMAAQATRGGPPGYGQVVTRTLGEQYAVCQSGGSSGWNAQYPDTQIVFQLDSGGGKYWQEGKGFKVFVYFVRAKQGAYPIVSAAIPGPQ
jgi:hypothetical protein